MTGTDTKGALGDEVGVQKAVAKAVAKQGATTFRNDWKALSARLRGQGFTHYLKQTEPTPRHTAGMVVLPLNRHRSV